jgi:hypothetical protein
VGARPRRRKAGNDESGLARGTIPVEDWRRKQMFLATHVRRERLPFILALAGAAMALLQ